MVRKGKEEEGIRNRKLILKISGKFLFVFKVTTIDLCAIRGGGALYSSNSWYHLQGMSF